MLFTVGYEGCDLDDLVGVLRDHGVDEVIDVRLTPASRKPGFSKARLSDALAEAGIGYRHLPELGNPRDNREGFRAGRPEALARYRARVDDEGRDAVQAVADAAREHRVALLCLERDASICHRRLVAEAVLELDPDLAAHHLE